MNVCFKNYYVYCVFNNDDKLCAWSDNYHLCEKYIEDRNLLNYTIVNKLVNNKYLKRILKNELSDIELIEYKNIICFNSEKYIIDKSIDELYEFGHDIINKVRLESDNYRFKAIEKSIFKTIENDELCSQLHIFNELENASKISNEIRLLDAEYKNIIL